MSGLDELNRRDRWITLGILAIGYTVALVWWMNHMGKQVLKVVGVIALAILAIFVIPMAVYFIIP